MRRQPLSLAHLPAEGLKRVLTSTVQRLADTGGDPGSAFRPHSVAVKTHTMLAIFHLARHLSEGGDASRLAGVGEIVEKTGARKAAKAQDCGVLLVPPTVPTLV